MGGRRSSSRRCAIRTLESEPQQFGAMRGSHPRPARPPDPALEVFEHDPEPAVRAAAAVPWSRLARSRLPYPLLLRRRKEATSGKSGRRSPALVVCLPLPCDPPSADRCSGARRFWCSEGPSLRLGEARSFGRPALPALAKAARRELADPQGLSHSGRAIATIDRPVVKHSHFSSPLSLLQKPARNFQRHRLRCCLQSTASRLRLLSGSP